MNGNTSAARREPFWRVKPTAVVGAAVAAVVLATAAGAYAQVIPPGQDCLETKAGTTRVVFGGGGGGRVALPPIPADFFFDGSLPWEGAIELRGETLPGYIGAVSTLVERKEEADVSEGPVTIEVELKELSLVSTAPITVTGSAPDRLTSFFDVFVTLNPGQPSTGYMTITGVDEFGGSFELTEASGGGIEVYARFNFFEAWPSRKGRQLTLDPPDPLLLETVQPQSYQYDTPPLACTAGQLFYPVPGDVLIAVLNDGDAGTHGVIPPRDPDGCCLPGGDCIDIDPIDCSILGGEPQEMLCAGYLEACCVPDPADPVRMVCLDVDPVCCDDLGGIPQGPGTACVDMTIACCRADGSCVDVDPLCCDDLLGWEGYHDQCLGDVNSNGIDDACEPPVIPAGYDYFETTVGSSRVEIGGTSGIPPIPANFFFEGSLPYEGTIELRGDPIPGYCAAVNTVVERLEDAAMPGPAAVEVELKELSLVSMEPITVIGPDRTESFFDVFVSLNPDMPSTGSMTIEETVLGGGGQYTLDAQSGGGMYVYFRFSFFDVWPSRQPPIVWDPPVSLLLESAPQQFQYEEPPLACEGGSEFYPVPGVEVLTLLDGGDSGEHGVIPPRETDGCCLPGGECINWCPEECPLLGGMPQGALCFGWLEACCLPDGGCVMVDPLCCDDLGGNVIWGEVCTGWPEACCDDFLPKGCMDADPMCCEENLGGWTPGQPFCQGDVNSNGTDDACELGPAPQACCDTNGVCTNEIPQDCTAHGGTPQGPGTACIFGTIACCLSDGSCVDLDPLCCDDLGGQPSPTGAPACLGDPNSNGVDDACEIVGTGIEVGINIDVHQDNDLGTSGANDFHIEGRIESGQPGQGWANPPRLLDHVDDLFPFFTYSITPDLTDPEQIWYDFTADWCGHEYFYCDVLHAGLLFEVTCHNVLIDLVGWWTVDGVRVGGPGPARGNQGYWPILGFDVQDQREDQYIRIQNGDLDDTGVGGEIELWVVDMGLVSFADRQALEDALGGNPFRELRLGGAQEDLNWTAVHSMDGPISETNPIWMPPDSFFNVFLKQEGGGMYWPEVDMVVPPGGYLIARERIYFTSSSRQEEWRWLWEMHEAHGPELGDAPDSSNNSGAAMTAYPIGGPPGVVANFPSVFGAGSPPHGPIHWAPRAAAWLGEWVSLEDEADLLPDEDPTTNLDPPGDTPDLDLFDDGVNVPLPLPHCQWTTFGFTVTTGAAPVDPMYVNVWFDWSRDGDWGDMMTCPIGAVDEWAVHDMVLAGLVPYTTYSFVTPQFLPWHATEPPGDIWMRITLSEQPWPWAAPPGLGYGGAGPAGGYQFGETEDYYFAPGVPFVAVVDAAICLVHDDPCGLMCLPGDCSDPDPPYDKLEPRLQLGTPPILMIQCDGPVPQGSASVSVSCVPNDYMGDATVVSDGTPDAEVQFSDTLPNHSCCTLAFAGSIQDIWTMVMLEGDVNKDGMVSTADMSSIKARLGDSVQDVGAQYDVNRDCQMSTADRSSVKSRLGHLAPVPCLCP